jgi:cation:H+ antiporter
MAFFNVLLYGLSFFFIWYGSGLIISSVSKFSSRLKLSPFAFSFVFLGLLTSTPEFSVGLQAVFDHEAEIFVGNLLGGIVVLFLVVIPILAIVANGVSLKHELDNRMLLATLAVIIAPSVAILDKKVTNLEGALLVVMYLVLLFLVERKKGIFDNHNTHILDVKAYSYKDLLKTILGIGIVFASSNVIVSTTEYFALFFNIAPFYISLIVVAIGTDLPELSLAIRSVVSSKKEIAMGDYIGAAAVSTFLFGLFTLFHNGEVLTINNFLVPFFFILVALSIFYILSRTKQYISRTHGILMVGLYVVFVLFGVFGNR